MLSLGAQMEALLEQSGWSLKYRCFAAGSGSSRSFELVRRAVEGFVYKGQSGHFLAWL